MAYDGNAIMYTTRALSGNERCYREFTINGLFDGKSETYDVGITLLYLK